MNEEVLKMPSEKYILFEVDVGRFDTNLKVAEHFQNAIDDGIPSVAVVSSTGKILAVTNNGYFANARTMPATAISTFLLKFP